MQAIFSLIVDERPGRIDHSIGDFQSPMRRKAVEENGVRPGCLHQVFRNLIGSEDLRPKVSGIFLAHAGPDISINSLRTGYGVESEYAPTDKPRPYSGGK